MTEDKLLDSVRERCLDPKTRTEITMRHSATGYGKASARALESAASDLGVPLPHLVRRLYAEVENGGFGPGAGLLGVEGGYAELDGLTLGPFYKRMREQGWPENIIPLVDMGSGVWAGVDGRATHDSLLIVDINGVTCTPFTLSSWLATWVSGADVGAATFEYLDGIIMNPFTRKPMATRSRGRAKGVPYKVPR